MRAPKYYKTTIVISYIIRFVNKDKDAKTSTSLHIYKTNSS